MKKLLVTGISSFLGKELAFFPQQEWKITGLFNHNEVKFRNTECLKCDITNAEKLSQIFNHVKPDAVMHLAALSNPNYCETQIEESFNANVTASMFLAQLADRQSIPIIFTSTDLVYDGKNAPYSETDALQPIMIYGKHKAEVEKGILQNNQKAIIARLPVIFGDGGFMKNWIETLRSGKTIAAFTDEYRSMISSFSAIEGLLLLLKRKEIGIWNLGGKERISRYDFAVKMAKAFDLKVENILPSLRKDVTMPAARPADVSMRSEKSYEVGFDPLPIDKALEKIKHNQNFKLI